MSNIEKVPKEKLDITVKATLIMLVLIVVVTSVSHLLIADYIDTAI